MYRAAFVLLDHLATERPRRMTDASLNAIRAGRRPARLLGALITTATHSTVACRRPLGRRS